MPTPVSERQHVLGLKHVAGSLHRKMDFEEFVSIYNALNLNQTDFSNADFF